MSRTYVGHQQEDRRWVDIIASGTVTPLTNRGRWSGSFGWGSRAAGSVSLARSILWDVTGTDSSDGMAIMFAGDVIAQLPEDFALSEHEVRDWLETQLLPRMSPHELVEHLGTIALADPDEESENLRGLVDRCWTGSALAN